MLKKPVSSRLEEREESKKNENIIKKKFKKKLVKSVEDNKKIVYKTQNKKEKIIKKSYIDKLDINSFGSIREGFSKGLMELGKLNKDVVVLSADLASSVKVADFAKKYPKRFFEFGIAEQNMMSASAGMCLNNKIPFVTSYAVFNPGRNWDQVRVSVCYSNANIKIFGSHAGLLTGADGATHQALEDIAITKVLANMCVISPCDEEEMRKAVIESVKYNGPVYLRGVRENSLNITNKNTKFEIGKSNVLDKGDDLLIVSCGICVRFALEAKRELLKLGIDSTVLNMHTIKPVDEHNLLKYAKKCKKVITIEDHQVIGGLGSSVCDVLSEKCPVRVEKIGMNDKFGESGEGYNLLEKYNISTKEIIKRAKKLVK
ncbi:MAG: transketolase family protein [Nanoarchaeota archaeon]